MVIGITGSSGAGKSTVCEILQRKYQITVINADKIARQLLQNRKDYLIDIVKQFGTEILLDNGELNRSKLANIIYNDNHKKEELNNCTFKYIKEEIKKQIEENELKFEKKLNGKEQIIVIDAPLLFEAELEKICTFVIAIISKSKEVQINRIINRDKITEKEAILRLKAQNKNEFYTNKSKYVIENNGDIEELEKQVEKVFNKIM